MSRQTRGTIRLPTASACSASSRHTGEAALSGDTTNTNASAASMAERTSSIHLADGGMPSQSTHTSRPAATSAPCRRRTKSWSRRLYETKTSAIDGSVRSGSRART